MVVAVERIRTLNKYEKSILITLERGMKRCAWMPLEEIRTRTGLSESEVNYRLSRLIAWGMVRFNPVPYDGYALVLAGTIRSPCQPLQRTGRYLHSGPKSVRERNLLYMMHSGLVRLPSSSTVSGNGPSLQYGSTGNTCRRQVIAHG